MKITILGTDYDYAVVKHEDDSRLRENDGFTDSYEKTIHVASDYYDDDPGSIRCMEEFMAKVKRHEIVHAFFFESGMSDWHKDETLVDWIAIQIPKMIKAFQEVGAV